MRATENRELWDEVLKISMKPVDEIEETPRLGILREAFFEKKWEFSKPNYTVIPKFDKIYEIEFDDIEFRKLLKRNRLSMFRLSSHLGRNGSYLVAALKRKRLPQTAIDIINDVLKTEVIKKVKLAPSTVEGGKPVTNSKIEFDKARLKEIMKEKGLNYITISSTLNRGNSFLTNALRKKSMDKKHVAMINELLGEEVIRIVTDA